MNVILKSSVGSIPATSVLAFLSVILLVQDIGAQEFKQFNVNYKLAGKNMSNTIYIPRVNRGTQANVRGVMQNVGGPLKDFAHRNQVALIARLDQGRGFSKELLAAAAEASGRPEVEFAGAIVQGISKGGRAAADWADANQKRAIAVILDHSAIWRMDFPKRVSGVPMYFNATHADMFQNIDRRKSHYEWCVAAFNARQPCTSVIDIVKNGGHGGRGTITLTAIWLEEVMNFRVPANVPVGKPYELMDVNPLKVGGYVSAKLSNDGKRTYHDKVKITAKKSAASWWIPGPKSAALYLDWVRKNGGSVEMDESAKIKNAPIYHNLSPLVTKAMDLVREQQWAKAHAALVKNKGGDDSLAKSLSAKVNANVASHLDAIKKQDHAGDVYGVYVKFQKFSKNYRGIPAYDEMFVKYRAFFRQPENKAKLKVGREFYDIVNRVNKAKRVNDAILEHVDKFVKAHAGTVHGKAAKKAYDAMLKDANVKLPPESYYILHQ